MIDEEKFPSRDVVKTILCGSPGVGKTTLREAYLQEDTVYEAVSALGVDFNVKEFIHEDLHILNQIWNMMKGTTLKNLRNVYFINARGAIFVYDCSRPKTLFDLRDWVQVFLEQCKIDPKEAILAFVENKIDLESKIDPDSIEKYLARIGREFSLNNDQVAFYRTSAVNNEGVDQVFFETSIKALKRLKK